MTNMPPCLQQIQTICSQISDPSGGADSGHQTLVAQKRCKIENCILHQQSETQLFLLPESFTEAFVLINATKVCFRGKYIQGCCIFLKTYSTGGLTKTFLGKKGQKSMFSGQNCRPGETRSDRLFMK